MKYLLFDEDVCIAASNAPRAGFIPNPNNIAMNHARLQDGKIIDVSRHQTFYIDERGLRHIRPAKDRQVISCGIDEPLIISNQQFTKESFA